MGDGHDLVPAERDGLAAAPWPRRCDAVQRAEQLRRGAEALADDSDDRAEARAVLADMETLRAWRRLPAQGTTGTADDLVSVALVKLLRRSRQLAAMEQPDAYVRQMLLRVYIDEMRRPWRREDFVQSPPDRPQSTADPTSGWVTRARGP